MWTFKLLLQCFVFTLILSLVSCTDQLGLQEKENVDQSFKEEEVHKDDVVDKVSEAEVEDETTKLANDLFKAAMAMLNSSNSDKDLAWDTMKKSAEVGSKKAQAKIAFAKLLGSYFDQVRVFC